MNLRILEVIVDSFVPGSLELDRLLAEKRALVDRLETDFAAHELLHQTLSAEVDSFHLRYSARVGVLYAELDRINAEIFRHLVQQDPNRAEVQRAFDEAKARARRSADEVNREASKETSTAFRASDRLKELYRRAAKQIHPDRADNEEDRRLRDSLMADVNRAYRRGDEAAIERIVTSYRDRHHPADSIDNMQIEELERAIGRLMTRIAEIKVAISRLRASDLCKLMQRVAQDESDGLDPLGEMANLVFGQIASSQAKLKSLQSPPKNSENSRADVGATPQDSRPSPSSRTSKAETSEHVDDEDLAAPLFRPEGLIHRTERGEFVRSKSEVIVANALYHQKLDYRYEYPIEGQVTGGIRRPDFVFIRQGSRPLVLEHLGMLQVSKYEQNWRRKLAWYQGNGFTLGEDLFVTQDGSDGSLDSKAIREVCEAIKYRI